MARSYSAPPTLGPIHQHLIHYVLREGVGFAGLAGNDTPISVEWALKQQPSAKWPRPLLIFHPVLNSRFPIQRNALIGPLRSLSLQTQSKTNETT